MRKTTIANLISAAALAAIPSFAGAQVDILGSDPLFGGNPATVTFTDFISTVDATFNAYTTAALIPGAPDGQFGQHSGDGFTGVGVAAGHAELGIGEGITVAFSNPILISSIRLAFLYDGPEFVDVQEQAVITANLLGGGTATGTLTALFDGNSSWTGLVGTVMSISPPAQPGGAGVWALNNPFGGWVTGLTFTAATGTCVPEFTCTSQSDYSIERISVAIPEPSTYAMLLAGLAVIGFMVRKRAARTG